MVKCIIAIAAICSSAIVPALGFVPQQASLSSRVPSIDYKSFDHSTKIFMAGGKVSNFFSKVTGRFRKEAEIPEVPSLAQTHMQGPLVNGAGAALTKEELEAVKAELEQIKKEFGLKEPERGFMDDEDIKWRFGGKPDYSVTNLLYLKQRSTVHKEGSLEMIVENLVKTVSFTFFVCSSNFITTDWRSLTLYSIITIIVGNGAISQARLHSASVSRPKEIPHIGQRWKGFRQC